MIRFTWGLLLGLVVGGVLALAIFAKPLCERGVRGTLDTYLGKAGVPSSIRDIIGGFV